jgi:Protein of unknown function (DUF3110)
MRVYVLLFNANTDNAGIHTLQLGNNNWVLMFESEDDATRYALLLEAQDFLAPTVEAIDADEVADFCSSAGYDYRFIPSGFVPETAEDRLLLAPPETNLGNTDWQPNSDANSRDEEPETGAKDPVLEEMRRRLEGLL